MIAEIERLNRFRLSRGLSLQKLAEHMRAWHCFVNPRTLGHLCKGDHDPQERTLFRIRKFLDSPGVRPRRRATDKRRTSAAAVEVQP
jgi:transcriptional regulator with XRE-family HTH domain